MSDKKYSPDYYIVPIFGMHEDGECGPFLGSGSFVGEKAILVTCDHVLEAWDHNYGIGIDTQDKLLPASVLKRDSDSDLALLSVDNYTPPYTLPLEDDENIISNELVICFEYGTTTTKGKRIELSPASRIGNITRFRDLRDMYGVAGEYMLEMSFPALKGASGAPITQRYPPFKLWGIVKANISSELMPAHVETIVDEYGKIEEETKFYLPQALAVHVKHVRKLLSEVNA